VYVFVFLGFNSFLIVFMDLNCRSCNRKLYKIRKKMIIKLETILILRMFQKIKEFSGILINLVNLHHKTS
jgi:protein-disulfide isomerase